MLCVQPRLQQGQVRGAAVRAKGAGGDGYIVVLIFTVWGIGGWQIGQNRQQIAQLLFQFALLDLAGAGLAQLFEAQAAVLATVKR
jgi:hypothetical protein